MRRPDLTVDEITAIVADHAAGVPIATITARHNIASSTLYHYVKARSNDALTGGRWVIDTRRRVQVWEPECDRVAS